MTKEALLQKIGKNIEKYRKEHGYSQADLAIRINRPRQNINRIERGGHNLSVHVLYEIAEALKIPVKDLMDFD